MGRSDYYPERETPRITDREANRLIRQGNVQELYFRLQRLVPYIIQKHTPLLRDSSIFDDAMQEGNIGLLKSFESWKFGAGASISTWAYPYIKRAVLKEIDRQFDYYRQNFTTDFSELLDDESATPTNPTDQAYDEVEGAGERAMKWQAEYDRVSELLGPREALLLDFLRDGLTIREVAEFLGVSAGTAKSQLDNVKDKVKSFEQNQDEVA